MEHAAGPHHLAHHDDDLDTRLFLRWRCGDAPAGTELALRHLPRISRYFAFRFHGDVRDLVQRTWLVVLEARDRVQQPGSFRGFYLGVARNVFRDELRRRRRAIPAKFEPTDRSDVASPADELESSEEIGRLHRAFEALDPDAAQLVRLHYWEHTTAPQLGRLLGIPENTARSRLRRAREFLRVRLS